MSLTSPKLWVVATPLGNPGDLSPRAREVLEGADMVLAEDTRRAGLLCQRCGVKAKRFMSFHDHNEESKLDEVLGLLNGGRTLALISDAGLPLVADPGYRLVRACRAAGIPPTARAEQLTLEQLAAFSRAFSETERGASSHD